MGIEEFISYAAIHVIGGLMQRFGVRNTLIGLVIIAISGRLLAVMGITRKPTTWSAGIGKNGKLTWKKVKTQAATTSTTKPQRPARPRSPMRTPPCKRCRTRRPELQGGFCGDCHLAGLDAGWVLTTDGKWLPLQPTTTERK